MCALPALSAAGLQEEVDHVVPIHRPPEMVLPPLGNDEQLI
jgi:hypothetical protein